MPVKHNYIIQEPKKYPLIEPDITEWPIYKLSAKRYEFIDEVKKISLQKSLSYFKGNGSLNEELARTLYQERIRLTQTPWKADAPDEKEFWSDIKKQLMQVSANGENGVSQDSISVMTSIISRYSNEIAGTFDPSIYEFAIRAVPFGFSRLLKTSVGQNFKEKLSHQFSVSDRIVIQGDMETIRELGKKHTLVMVPTHISNLDSMLIGWAIQELGLPAFIYGAGLNLFGIKILAYFMNRLGAYKVDRRKKNPLYLETLKTYSTLAIHKGCHSLFFPGGTRSRSGEVENKLKLGLLGTAMEAQYLNYLNSDNGDAKKIIIVPVVMNYHFILEAPNLIDEHLKRTGREFYLMERPDSYSTSMKMARFIIKFLTRSSKIYLSFSPCIDLFGNVVNKEGDSLDEHGNKLDLRNYFVSEGKLHEDPQRNEEYVKMLGDEIVKYYHQYNVALSSHLVAFTAFRMLRKMYKKLDVYGILRLPLEDTVIPYENFAKTVEKIRDEILQMTKRGEIKSTKHMTRDITSLVEHGLKNLGLYHDNRPLIRNKQGNIVSPDMKLLYFYHNRLEGYGFERFI